MRAERERKKELFLVCEYVWVNWITMEHAQEHTRLFSACVLFNFNVQCIVPFLLLGFCSFEIRVYEYLYFFAYYRTVRVSIEKKKKKERFWRTTRKKLWSKYRKDMPYSVRASLHKSLWIPFGNHWKWLNTNSICQLFHRIKMLEITNNICIEKTHIRHFLDIVLKQGIRFSWKICLMNGFADLKLLCSVDIRFHT